MLDGLISGLFDFIAYGIGRLVVWMVTLGRYAPKQSDEWWVSFLGLGMSVGIVAAVIRWVYI